MRKPDYRDAVTLILLLGLLVAGWTYTYDTDTPADSETPRLGASRIREIQDAVQELSLIHI